MGEKRDKSSKKSSLPNPFTPTVSYTNSNYVVDQRYRDTLKHAMSPHIGSFDWFVKHGIHNIVDNIPIIEVALPQKKKILSLKLKQFTLSKPVPYSVTESNMVLTPNECRESFTTYGGVGRISLEVGLRDLTSGTENSETIELTTDRIPVMVKSSLCHLKGMTEHELVKQREEPYEMGGYFVVKGSEKIIRLLISNRRNYPICLSRASWANEYNCTDKGVLMRCVRTDESSHLNTLHYTKMDTFLLQCGVPSPVFLPAVLILKALKNISDLEIYKRIIGCSNNNVDEGKIRLSLQFLLDNKIYSSGDAIETIGSNVKDNLTYYKQKGKFTSNGDLAREFLDRSVLPHLDSYDDKFDVLIYMIQKCLKFVNGEIEVDDIDSITTQEVLTPGQSFAVVFKTSLLTYLERLSKVIIKKSIRGIAFEGIVEAVGKFPPSVGLDVTGFLASGSVRGGNKLERPELPQMSGCVIVGEKLNFLRYLAHFRGIHRGSVFMDSRSLDVRRLKPDAWGYICPVHTPDGGPCGLLNHLTQYCKVTTDVVDCSPLESTLYSYGVVTDKVFKNNNALVLIDGRIVGSVKHGDMDNLVNKLRSIKVNNEMEGRYEYMEIEYIPYKPKLIKAIPYISINLDKSRFVRPVRNLYNGKIEYVGPSEQMFLHVACMDSDMIQGKTTHKEISPTAMLSFVANLTPFSDFNQSPRNVYQCQMAKQTMGLPLLTFENRTDNKLYRIQTPQIPISRTSYQEGYMPYNTYLTGTNAVVAVLAYTGYDMEDAMIVNKSSYERGLAHGTVYKTKKVDLEEHEQNKVLLENEIGPYLSCKRDDPLVADMLTSDPDALDHIGVDGLPKQGSIIKKGDILYSYFDDPTKKTRFARSKDVEVGIVDKVRIFKTNKFNLPTQASITLRYNRNPTIGDKFSSRHGQKGVMSMLWPQEDMPFTEGGLTPDIIINPHAFPSRMTIGMLVESLASKSGAVHGYYPDATPFMFDEKNRAVDHFGEELAKAGFNYHGNETMYSGTMGGEFKAEIFMGIVYYQRLRHMVKDKFQARAKGKMNSLTHQPIKGRKKGGGVRFGEMERDAIISYGASHILHDRLYHCSDEDKAIVCSKCKNMITHYYSKQDKVEKCSHCDTGDHLTVVGMPYVFHYLVHELTAMNIKVSLDVKKIK